MKNLASVFNFDDDDYDLENDPAWDRAVQYQKEQAKESQPVADYLMELAQNPRVNWGNVRMIAARVKDKFPDYPFVDVDLDFGYNGYKAINDRARESAREERLAAKKICSN